MGWSPFTLKTASQDAIADLPALKEAAQEIAAHVLHGAHGQRKSGGHERFWQFREYTSADRPQDIDWRQSAKGAAVFVREKELQTPQSVYFWAKRDAGMDFQSSDALYTKSEAAQILSLGLTMLFERGEERVGVIGQGRAGRGAHAIDMVGRYLLEGDDALLPENHVPAKSSSILCGDFLEPIESIERSFQSIAERGINGIVIQVMDIAERDLPYDGHRVFEDQYGKHKVDHVASIRSEYQARIAAHCDALSRLCSSLGWRYYLHLTHVPLHKTLQGIWEGHQR